MSKKKAKKIIIFIFIFVILLGIIFSIIDIVKKKKENEQKQEATENLKKQVSTYTAVEQFKSIEEVLVYLDSEFISENKAEDEQLDLIVTAKLKYDLSLENKNYYENLIQYSASATNYKNFGIIDKDKNIEIIVFCKNNKVSNYYINNEKFYFNKLENIENVTNYEEDKITQIKKTCDLLNKIVSQNWTINNTYLGTKESTFNGYDIYFDEGLEVKKINGEIYNIIFTEKYPENVIENLKVNSNKEQIKEALGEATFTKYGAIGYKTEKFYVFFSQDEISIYPIKTYSTDEIIQIIEKYKNTSNTQELINEIKQKWLDYDIYELSSNKLILQYTLKGISFNYNNQSDNGITIYSNYTGKVDGQNSFEDIKSEKASLPQNINFKNDNLVYLEEIKRLNNTCDYSEKDNFATLPVINTSQKYKTYINPNTNQLCFVSIKKENPNSELREGLSSGIWYNNEIFIYSISGKGIYKYNAKEMKYQTIIEGNEKYSLKEIKENVLYYDETSINL